MSANAWRFFTRGAAVCLAVSLGVCLLTHPPETAPPARPALPSAHAIPCDFYDKDGFTGAVLSARSYPDADGMLGGIVPHHLLAGQLIASFFKTAAESAAAPETVVLIGPLHESRLGKLVTSATDWQTPLGRFPADTELAGVLRERLGAVEDDALMRAEHSVAGLVPFARYYFPEAKVCCLLISRQAGASAPADIAAVLAEIAAEKSCFFVFSVDFSHYLDPDTTAVRDEESRALIAARDYDALLRLTNDHMDSPFSVCTFLMTMDALGRTVSELEHSNSQDILRLPFDNPAFSEGLTSYFVYGAG